MHVTCSENGSKNHLLIRMIRTWLHSFFPFLFFSKAKLWSLLMIDIVRKKRCILKTFFQVCQMRMSSWLIFSSSCHSCCHREIEEVWFICYLKWNTRANIVINFLNIAILVTAFAYICQLTQMSPCCYSKVCTNDIVFRSTKKGSRRRRKRRRR